ncbi:MAG TPA: glycosyltransferase family 39 protein [Chloroflexota bacterium]|nr:glycosyltransferase family 39 protein [Chloroflexota bacterium]
MDAAVGLALALYVVACSVPLGVALLRRLDVAACAGRDERLVAGAALGLGAQAYTLTLLGAGGLFQRWVVLAMPLALAVVAVPFTARPTRPAWRRPRLSLPEWAACAMLALVGVAVVVSDLAPPSDYDGLLYHLVAPRTYLEHGRLVYVPHNFSANLPALGEMLFAVGLAGGSDRAPQLIHASAGALGVALTYHTARRLLPASTALWGAAGFAATPLVPFLMTRAYIDLFTVVFCVLATWALVDWQSTPRPNALLVCGAALGLAVSTKYAALPAAVGVGAVVCLVGWRRGGPATAVQCAVVTASTALAASLPWLARQITMLGNPLWPMYVGGRDWDAARVEQLTYFVRQYGSGSGLGDFVLLPVNVFRESWRFGHVPWSFPPPVAVAAPLAAWSRHTGVRSLLVGASIATFLWAVGWQDLRFLLTIYPLLALLGAAGAYSVAPPRRAGPIVALLVCGTLVMALAREGQRAFSRIPVVIGLESADAFLRREVSNHAAMAFLNGIGDPGDGVLFLGSGPTWYCRVRCIPDPAHDNLLVFVLGGQPHAAVDSDAVRARLRAEGVGYVLLSKVDYWYLEHQDPEGRLKRQLAEFYVFKSRYLESLYEDASNEVYRLR